MSSSDVPIGSVEEETQDFSPEYQSPVFSLSCLGDRKTREESALSFLRGNAPRRSSMLYRK